MERFSPTSIDSMIEEMMHEEKEKVCYNVKHKEDWDLIVEQIIEGIYKGTWYFYGDTTCIEIVKGKKEYTQWYYCDIEYFESLGYTVREFIRPNSYLVDLV